MRLYDYLADGTTELVCTYICSRDGEAQYLRWEGEEKHPFGNAILDLNLPVPYQPGDILYVDCRPYSQPAYCIITEVGDDCCGVQCLYPGKDGAFHSGAFKHGNYFEGAYGVKQYLSPLYRAERYEGEFPPLEAIKDNFNT